MDRFDEILEALFGLRKATEMGFTRVEGEIARLDRELGAVHTRLNVLASSVNNRIDSLEGSVNARFDALDGAMHKRFDGVERSLSAGHL